MYCLVEIPLKPSKGLKRISFPGDKILTAVEIPLKPSKGLKHHLFYLVHFFLLVEIPLKPSKGLKHAPPFYAPQKERRNSS